MAFLRSILEGRCQLSTSASGLIRDVSAMRGGCDGVCETFRRVDHVAAPEFLELHCYCLI